MKNPSWFPIRPEYDSISGVAASSRSMPTMSFWVSIGDVPGGRKEPKTRPPPPLLGKKPGPGCPPRPPREPRGHEHDERREPRAPHEQLRAPAEERPDPPPGPPPAAPSRARRR